MKKVLYFFLTIFCIGCKISKTPVKIVDDPSYTQRELDLLGALEYIQNENKECRGDCVFRVNGTFEYFDNCLMAFDSAHFESLGLEIDMKNSYYPNNFQIKEFGTIFFTNPRDSLDYYFSPVLYNPSKQSMIGQVREKNGERYTYGLNLVKDRIYYSSRYYYPEDCFGGYDVWE